MQPQYCFIHHSRQQKDFLNLFFTWHFPSLVLESNGNLGFEEALLLLRGCSHTTIVAKLISPVKFCTIDCCTGFAPLQQAQIASSLHMSATMVQKRPFLLQSSAGAMADFCYA